MVQSIDPFRYAVLVVEDDALVRAEAVDLCIEAGFTTYEARNAEQALRQLERHSEIRVLATDVEMPGTMDGLKLARAVRDRWPPVTIMVTSGRMKVTKEDRPRTACTSRNPTHRTGSSGPSTTSRCRSEPRVRSPTEPASIGAAAFQEKSRR